MKKYLKLIMLFVGLSGCDQFFPERLDLSRSPMTVLLEDQIQPRYTSLVSEASNLRNLASEFCLNPDNKNFGLLQQQWRTTMLSWQSAEAVSQLMLEENMESWRFQFWPDKKNLTGRKVEARLKSATPIPLLSDSVILQGLSASEYLLFDSRANDALALKKSEYCQFLMENTEALFANSMELQQNWEKSGNYYLKLMAMERGQYAPGLDGWVLNSLDAQTSRLKKELALPLGKNRTNLFLAESWRSQQSLENIRTVLATADSLVALAIEQSANQEQAALWQGIVLALNRLSLAMQNLPYDFTTAIEQGRIEELHQLKEQINSLSQQIVKTAGKLQVPLGFNSSDGD
ncbi:imelysin family protein [Endozoicomonas sp. YOMI1]|uniref:imelysin family protein n=1 Tax=Endozoicomonas sp. YOMI1 TaxID=2828739 RepID=UPI0021495267|nr:imelysin family protein [Endozoicomonas sp. YOMI1]